LPCVEMGICCWAGVPSVCLLFKAAGEYGADRVLISC
jgi:hypothetical protein